MSGRGVSGTLCPRACRLRLPSPAQPPPRPPDATVQSVSPGSGCGGVWAPGSRLLLARRCTCGPAVCPAPALPGFLSSPGACRRPAARSAQPPPEPSRVCPWRPSGCSDEGPWVSQRSPGEQSPRGTHAGGDLSRAAGSHPHGAWGAPGSSTRPAGRAEPAVSLSAALQAGEPAASKPQSRGPRRAMSALGPQAGGETGPPAPRGPFLLHSGRDGRDGGHPAPGPGGVPRKRQVLQPGFSAAPGRLAHCARVGDPSLLTL